MKYSINSLVSSNIAFFPIIDDALSAQVADHGFANNSYNDTKRRLTGDGAPTQFNPSVSLKLRQNMPTIGKAWDFLQDAYAKVSPYIGTAMRIGSIIAPLLGSEEPIEHELVVCVA